MLVLKPSFLSFSIIFFQIQILVYCNESKCLELLILKFVKLRFLRKAHELRLNISKVKYLKKIPVHY